MKKVNIMVNDREEMEVKDGRGNNKKDQRWLKEEGINARG